MTMIVSRAEGLTCHVPFVFFIFSFSLSTGLADSSDIEAEISSESEEETDAQKLRKVRRQLIESPTKKQVEAHTHTPGENISII